ncbi:MAG: cytochrome c oxidase assembly protein [Caulobacteraceae bacterium]|nr:cytochrome c oxidase assembly protein [Caulobacteraceae bacterium]
MKGGFGATFLILGTPLPAAAHDLGGAGDVHWSFEPWAGIPILLSALLFVVGAVRLSTRGTSAKARAPRQAWLFAAGLSLLALATLSPLHQLGERAFAAHMLEHELIMLAAAPLLVMSRPLPVMMWAFPLAGRKGLGAISRARLVSVLWRGWIAPLPATLIQAAALWLWHLPWLFDRALASEPWHVAQHLSFFVSALFFWSAMLGPARNAWLAGLCLFATSMISGALGALMALSLSPWYSRYVAMGMTPLHMTPTQDQQLAGILMWVPGGMVHAIAALMIVAPQLKNMPKARRVQVTAPDQIES